MRLHPTLGTVRPHTGTDYRTPVGTALAVPPGHTSATYRAAGGYGNTLFVQYPGGIELRYAHLSSGSGNPPTAIAGNTGRSTGPHLHFEVRLDGVPVDPVAAMGLDLTDPAVRECLIRHAQFANSSTSNRGQRQGECGSTGSAPPDFPIADNPYGDPSIDVPGRPAQPTFPPPPSGAQIGIVTAGGTNYQGNINYEFMQGDSELTTQACDIDMFITMRAKATLEAQSDVIYNAMAVKKPDSVLAYSCIDHHAGILAHNAGPIFSETSTFDFKPAVTVKGSVVLIGPVPDAFFANNSLDDAIERTTLFAATSYLSQQFPHTFVGDSTTLSWDVGGTVGSGAYTCDWMQQVWQEAKCQNFSDTRFFAPGGPFYSFNELAGNDPRRLGAVCNASGILPVDVEIVSTRLLEYLTSFDRAQQIAVGNTGSMVNMSEVVSTDSCGPMTPIPTGIQVKYLLNAGEAGLEEMINAPNDGFAEHICANPGCYYDFENQECTR